MEGKSMIAWFRWAGLVLLAVALSACGGGGGDAGGNVPPPPVNHAPIAAISGPTSGTTGTTFHFDGAGSSDSDGDTLSYRWSLSVPTGSVARLNSATVSRVSLQPDVAGAYQLALVVSDGRLDSAEARHVLTATVPPPIRATLRSPESGQNVGTTVDIIVTVQSTYEVQQIRASLAGRETVLAFAPDAWCQRQCSPGYGGTISLAGLSPGVYPLSVRALDVRGNEDLLEVTVTYDQPPTLTVRAPLDQSVATTSIAVEARCGDDLPGCQVEALVNDRLLRTAQTILQEDLDLAEWAGRRVTLTLRARDSAAQFAEVARTIYVEAGTGLTRLLDLPGEILDVSGSRLLYAEHDEAGDSLTIHDASSGRVERVDMPPGRTVTPGAAFLTPSGAIFVTKAVDGNVLSSRLYLWRSGTFTDLAYPNSAMSLRVDGDYAIWSEASSLYRLDTRGSTPERLATDAGNIDNSIAADGTVAYWTSGYDVVLITGGVPSVITNDPSQWHTYPVTDGRVAVYRKHDPCCSNQQYQIDMFDGNSTVQLSYRRSAQPVPGTDYQVRAGWVAFTDIGNLGQLHVWTRSPAGVLLRHTDLGTTSRIDTLADNGEIMLLNGAKRYLSRGAGLVEISSVGGRSYWREGRWFLAIGRSFFEVDDR